MGNLDTPFALCTSSCIWTAHNGRGVREWEHDLGVSAASKVHNTGRIEMIVVEQQGGGRCAPGLALLRTWTQRELPACIGE